MRPPAVIPFVAAAVAVFAGVYVLSNGARPGAFARDLLWGSAALAVALGGYLVWDQRRPGSVDFPDLLRAQFEEGAIFERSGVQVAVGGTLSEDGSGELLLYVQNCWSGPRTVRVQLDDGQLGAPAARRPRFPGQVEARLVPAEVGELAVPIAAPADGSPFTLSAGLSVSGSGGRRARPWEARALETRFSPGMTAALAPLGVLAWGGGLSVSFDATPPGDRRAELQPPAWRSAWTPRPVVAPS